jgi:hypothetical protein
MIEIMPETAENQPVFEQKFVKNLWKARHRVYRRKRSIIPTSKNSYKRAFASNNGKVRVMMRPK